ncbi:MAG: hypothetical protein KIT17_03050 [Rubrivivax sp.]|nr:hypothetical protein [Rubrivivax sp.]
MSLQTIGTRSKKTAVRASLAMPARRSRARIQPPPEMKSDRRRLSLAFALLATTQALPGCGGAEQDGETLDETDSSSLWFRRRRRTAAPTTAPTTSPTAAPTVQPTSTPTAAPTTSPTAAPTATPTLAPTTSPTPAPTAAPTPAPTPSPTSAPSPTTPPTSPPATGVPTAIANLAAGRWLELPNTKIRSVLPPTQQTGYPPYLVEAWNGGAVDTLRNRLLVWGGGHNDYWGNEMYAIDLPTMSVKRIIDPSPYTGQSANTSALPDGTPTSRHTYDGLTYIAGRDELFSAGGSLSWRGDGERATWVRSFGQSRWEMTQANSPMSTTFGTMAEYDPVSGLVYVKDQSDFFSWNPATRVYTKLNSTTQAVDYHLSATIDTKRRKFVMLGDGVQVIDLNTRALTRMSTSNAPSFVTSQQSPGVAYDPIADRIVAWHGGASVYALDMDTGVWSQVATNAGPAASAPYQGTFGRWGYVPQYRVFVLVNSIDQNAWVFRLAS